MVYGPPASYKSFLCLGWGLSIASGWDWCNLPVTRGKVLYALGEGKSGLLKRIQAWRNYEGHTYDARSLSENFRVSFEVPQLATKLSIKEMLHDLEREEFNPDVIFLDTYARSLVGKDENSTQDAGMWVEGADILRQMGYTVVLIHHSKKNTEAGLVYRGNTALEGAIDTSFLLHRCREEPRKLVLTCKKQKEHIEPEPIYLEKIPVQVPEMTEGSVVLAPTLPPETEALEARVEQRQHAESVLDELLKNMKFHSDRERARQLALDTGVSEAAAQSRISRYRRRANGGV